jgi:hypothetical protein
MSLDDALSSMELVGHDFYLFLDAGTGMPSVVYRRCGYDYGVIHLSGSDERTSRPAAVAPTDAGATSPGSTRADLSAV